MAVECANVLKCLALAINVYWYTSIFSGHLFFAKVNYFDDFPGRLICMPYLHIFPSF